MVYKLNKVAQRGASALGYIHFKTTTLIPFMSKIYLIRHGQASLGKANYDQLSELGEKQALKVGDYLRRMEIMPDAIIAGDMQRHQQTADYIIRGMGGANHASRSINTDWNEFDFQSLIKQYLAEQPRSAPKPSTPSEFFAVLRQALLAWSESRIEGSLPESWQQFEERTNKALNSLLEKSALRASDSSILVVSSGGVISMIIKHLLQLSAPAMVDLNLQSRNTGITELFAKHKKAYLSCLNHVSHLSNHEDKSMITYA